MARRGDGVHCSPSTMVKHGSHLRGSVLAAVAMDGGRNRGRGLKLYVLRQRDSSTSKSNWIPSSPVEESIPVKTNILPSSLDW